MADDGKEEIHKILRRGGYIPSSFLSPRFQQLLCRASVVEVRNEKCLSSLKLLNWQHLQEVFPDEQANDSTYFEECAKIIAPCLGAVHNEMKIWTLDNFKNRFGQHLRWTGNEQLIEESFLYSLTDGAPVLLSLLTLTAALERALGNVYLIKGKQCPSMLKDLLVMRELSEIFSPFIMQFLRILIGPPISINIRNVAWHGFPSPEEVHPKYCHILLAIIASLGYHLELNHLSVVDVIPHRPPVQFPEDTHLPISAELITRNTSVIHEVLKASPVVPPCMHPVWKCALDLIKERRYGSAMILILPQLEMSCRLIFTAANECPHRLLTAEATELFTTFDEMLQKFLSSGAENKLPACLGEGIMNCLMDLLTYPEGPKVRDRVSHGECDIPNFPAHLASHVLCLSTAVGIKFLPQDLDLIKNDVVMEVKDVFDQYMSHYHPINLLKKEVLEVMNCLSKWKTSPRPTIEQLEYKNRWETLDEDQRKAEWSDVTLIICNGHSIADGLCPQICKPFSDLGVLQNKILTVNISTLCRSQSTDHQSAASEEEVIGLCWRIMQNSVTVSRQVMEGLTLKYQQWEGKTLRSRQRNTYARMLDSIPDISSGLRCVLLFIMTIYITFENGVSEIAINRKRIKALKQTLQYVENLVTYTSVDKNRWEEGQRLTSQFYGKLSSFLK